MQNSQESTCARAFFLSKLQAKALLKKRLWHRYFSVNSAKFLRTLFIYRPLPGDYFLARCYLKLLQIHVNFTKKNTFHFISTDQLTLGLIHHSKRMMVALKQKFFSPALQLLSALLTEFDEAMTWEITAEENIQNSPQPPITSSPDKLCLIRFFSFATSDRQTHNLKFPEIWYYFEYSGRQEALN